MSALNAEACKQHTTKQVTVRRLSVSIPHLHAHSCWCMLGNAAHGSRSRECALSQTDYHQPAAFRRCCAALAVRFQPWLTAFPRSDKAGNEVAAATATSLVAGMYTTTSTNSFSKGAAAQVCGCNNSSIVLSCEVHVNAADAECDAQVVDTYKCPWSNSGALRKTLCSIPLIADRHRRGAACFGSLHVLGHGTAVQGLQVPLVT